MNDRTPDLDLIRQAIAELNQREAPDRDGWFTAREYAQTMQMTRGTVCYIISSLVHAGKMEVRKILCKNVTGGRSCVPHYKFKG